MREEKEKECLRRPKGSALWKPTWGSFDWTGCVAKSRRESCLTTVAPAAGA
ncbi:hypothetical protein DVDV_3705 [Desulfovibrio sp. DV]|nr:hypothetical protein DVDV_3705 [Desulfovibrio sp. DV]